ncbi:seminase-like [Teleopsis dalmanni]|uniref:seminase-like n=1 Tax=Teleopsis dalmanni TaxID=139649 RepID=UPI0018CD45BC|nr:seminase-like [Teleopsis dalmanni]
MYEFLLRLLLLNGNVTDISEQNTNSTNLSNSTAVLPLVRTPRIIGGYATDAVHLPYLINISKFGVFTCGGALITQKCVITAAHCTKDAVASDFSVRGGITYLSEKRNIRRVRQFFVSPLYDKKALDYDVAILQLSSLLEGRDIETIQLSDKNITTGDVAKEPHRQAITLVGLQAGRKTSIRHALAKGHLQAHPSNGASLKDNLHTEEKI